MFAPSLLSSQTAPIAAPGRWLHVVSHTDPRYGGLSSAVPELGQRLSQMQGFETGLAAFCSPGERFQPSGYTSETLGFWPASRLPWLTSPGTRHSFAAQLSRYHGVHIHGLWEQSTFTASRTALSLGRPYLLSAHGMLEPWALAQKRLKKSIYAALIEHTTVARASCLHALTRAEARHFLDFGARSPIAVIPNAVQVPQRKDPTLFLDAFPTLRDKRLILFLARLHPKKGLDLLLSAWNDLHARWPDASLVVAGPDSEGTRARLESFVAAHHLSASVVFTGMLDEPLKWSALAAAECFILPSHSEGLSMSALEAMGIGLPVIVTKPCHMPEVRQYEAGWEIEPNAGSITLALEEFLENSAFENLQIGCRGADLVANRYSYATTTRQMAELYEWLQGGPFPRNVDLIYP